MQSLQWSSINFLFCCRNEASLTVNYCAQSGTFCNMQCALLHCKLMCFIFKYTVHCVTCYGDKVLLMCFFILIHLHFIIYFYLRHTYGYIVLIFNLQPLLLCHTYSIISIFFHSRRVISLVWSCLRVTCTCTSTWAPATSSCVPASSALMTDTGTSSTLSAATPPAVPSR